MERLEENGDAWQALQEAAGLYRDGGEQRAELGQFGSCSSGASYFRSTYYVLSAPLGNTGGHDSMSHGVQEGFLEEGTSQLTPEKQQELEEKRREESRRNGR